VPAFPGAMRWLVGLVGVETGASPAASPRAPEADELGLRCHYQLAGISYLGLGPAALAAVLAEVPLLGFGGPAAATGRPGEAPAIPGGHQPAFRHVADVPPAPDDPGGPGGPGGPGAANTVAYASGRLIGTGPGPSGPGAAAVQAAAHMPARHVVVLGAGAAAQAVARAAIRLGAERLTIAGVLPAAAGWPGSAFLARSSPGRVRVVGPDDIAGVLADADGLIQAVPVGTKPQRPAAVPVHLCGPRMWSADVSYRPLGEYLLRRPGSDACPEPSGSGRGVRVRQMAGAFRLAAGPGADAERALEYLAALTGTVAANARAEAGPDRHGQLNYPHAPAS
jgi:quinate/shikimate dehydrogenase (NAD+)